jgi:hypothetical protein
MKYAYITIRPGRSPPPQNGCMLKLFFFPFFLLCLKTCSTSSTFTIQPDHFSQNQPAAISLNTESPRTLPTCDFVILIVICGTEFL